MDISDVKRQIGLRFKELRLAKGLKQEDLERWDFSYRYYGKLERGLVNPTLATLLRLCEIFDVTLVDLFRFMEKDGLTTDDRESVAINVSKILKENEKKNIQKLKIFMSEILPP
ncbi:MAG: helix-turn-helix transcriptional regulator [Deltaproteobacteria bacterium]|nr:helix-turn-helix transcriptional regulator [Deltaproteobacteria bacterium]